MKIPNGSAPLWALLPLQDQVVSCLSEEFSTPVDEIAEYLGLTEAAVLYALKCMEGRIVYREGYTDIEDDKYYDYEGSFWLLMKKED